MNNPDTEEIVNYLSTKFNKIFCDRDFVCCVAEDFRLILKNKNECCVLVFPVLGPIYQKAVRYQAKIFDLAVFALTCGKHKSLAVCQKQYLVKKSVEVKEEVMAESGSTSRRKRPERQLYVPPAQRSSRLFKEESPPKNNIKKCELSKVHIHSDRNAHRKNKIDEQPPVQENKEFLIPLHDLLNLQCTNFIPLYWKYQLFLDDFSRIIDIEQHKNCIFYRYIYFGERQDAWNIPIYSLNNSVNVLYVLSYNCLLWQPKLQLTSSNNKLCANYITYPVYDFTVDVIQENQQDISMQESLIFNVDDLNISNNSCNADMCNVFEVMCLDNNVKSDDVIDLTVHKLPHFFMLKNYGDSDYCFACEEQHSIEECYTNNKSKLLEMINGTSKNGHYEEPKVLEISKVKTNDLIKNNINSNKEKLKVHDKELSKKHEHDQEKEIMRKTKENINRKTKPIMKYVEDNNDTLKIDKSDNVNNWEDLFDDEGQLQDELFTEIKQKVGNNVTIVKATEDYSAYATKPIEEFEHVVELYNFPPSLETHDIIQVFSDINSDAMYIKWVDDTHALLVLGSLSQAQKAVELDNPLIKARPMSAASGISLAVAYKSDLKPAMKRPQTNLQTARRLITSHLGAKTKISKEQSAKEREDLKAAREMRRQAKQNERDAWEGFSRSST